MKLSFSKATAQIVEVGRQLAARGSAPATAGNYSMRLGDGNIAVTVSGRDKSRLAPDDVMRISPDGVPLEDKTPSAETWLHLGLYNMFPQTNAVLHSHASCSVIIGRRRPNDSEIVLRNYELLKAFPGIYTHDTQIRIPIFENTQDMRILGPQVEAMLEPTHPAYLIRNHGFYAWGEDMASALRVLEATEYLFECENAL